VRTGARLYGIGWVSQWRDLDLSELTVLLTTPESDDDRQVRSTRGLAEAQRAYEEGRGDKPNVPASGMDLAFAAASHGMLHGPLVLPPTGGGE